MKSMTLVVTAALILASGVICSFPTVSFAEYGSPKTEEKMDAKMEAKTPPPVEAMTAMTDDATATVDVGNKICPIDGGPIEEGKAFKVTYNGKTYNLCCSMCEAEFNKDPEAAIKKIESMDSVKADAMDAAAEGMEMDGSEPAAK